MSPTEHLITPANASPASALPDEEVFVCPASLTQEGLWFLDRLDPGRPTYNIPTAFALRGHVDWPVFQAALDDIVDRHEALRTSLEAQEDGAPIQVISPSARVVISHVSLAGEADADARVRALVQAEAAAPFDLTVAPLLRVRAFTLDPAHHVISVVFHHIVADGWSLGIFFQELGRRYAERLAGQTAPWEPVGIQYADYTIWQRERLTPELTESQLAYWRDALREAPDSVELPTDRPRPARPSGRGETMWYTIGAEATDRLRDLCRAEHTTLFTAIVAVINVLLARHTGEYDVLLGTPMASRTRQELEGTIGFFANTLVLRSRLAPDVTFREALRRARTATLDAYQHADVSFHQVVSAVQPDRVGAAHPLFQVMCAFQKVPGEWFSLPNLVVEPIHVASGTAKFDLLLEFQERTDRVDASLEYATDLFDEETIARWVARMQTLADAAGRDPDLPISRLAVLPPDERAQLARWNDTAVPRPAGATVVSAFVAQAAATPDAPAVQFADETLSYAELHARTNRLARWLRQARGVTDGHRVGICLERSVDTLVSVLAVLKAGAAYVPMDPAYPRDRLAYMAEDADVTLIIADGSDAARALPNQQLLVDIADCWTAARGLSDESLDTTPSPASPCFVMYTSGSTGRPKGVVMPHGPLFNLIAWQLPRSKPRLKTLQYGSLSFDVSFHEMFATWLEGGHLVIIPESARRNAEELLAIIQREQAERIFIPFIALQLLAETALAHRTMPASLKEVQTAGEQLRITPAIRAFFEAMPDVPLDNHYGPTEAHVVTGHRLTGSPATWPELPPIGTPIDNTRIHLLDRALQQTPIGAVGDLWIGGACLADGYWRRPDLTAERFVVVDVDGRSERLYRSGDRARYDRNGAIEYLGRDDDQVKIRGYRVEPAEIEAVLERHPGVQRVAVVPRRRESGLILAAFYAPVEGAAPTTKELRDFLRETLPDYMVPSAFVALDAFPVTPSGKINRRGLPSIDEAQAARDAGGVPPKNAIEEQLVEIWKDVLGVPSVGTRDGFFDIGGHSLAAVRVVARIEKALGVALPLSALFETPTVAALAEAVSAKIAGGQHAAPIVARHEARGPHPLSFGQERTWFLEQLATDSPFYNIIDAIPLHGAPDPAALRAALAALAARHDSLRTAIVVHEGQPVQQVAETVDVPWEERDLSALDADAREAAWIAAAQEQGRRPFDLTQPPLFRALFLRLTPTDQLLVLTIHHIVSDEWSLQVLRRELRLLYDAAREGRPPASALAPLPVQYADYARWQRDGFTPEVRARQLAYWRTALADAPALLDLPTDRPRPPVQRFFGATYPFDLPKELFTPLRQLGREEQATPFITSLAAFAALLHRYSAQEDVLIGTPISGRTRSETESLIGLFLNTVIVRASFVDGLSFRALLRQVRERALGAYAHQDVPFEQVVADVRPARALSHSPLFQVMFIQHGVDVTGETAAHGFRNLDTGTAKFDLTLLVSEADGRLEGLIEYNTDLFDARTIQRIADQFCTLVSAVVREPDADLASLSILPDAERHRVLVEWNDTRATFAEAETDLATLLERQAAATPGRVAVTCGDESRTYAELDARANQLAQHLRACGAQRGDVIGVMLERSVDLVPTLLAILKCGAAYLPLDPAFPSQRLGTMVDSSGVRLLVSHRGLERSLPRLPETIVRLDDDAAAIDARSTEPVRVEVAPSDLAYVLYTSGSTGTPKGVEIPHRALVNLLCSMRREPGFSADDTILAVTTLSFDIATLEIFLPLFTGGALVLATREDARDPRRLIDALRTHGITVMQATPATWQAMVDAGWRGSPSLKAMTGGERLSSELARDLLARVGELWNLYGPTETTIYSTGRRITDAANIDIGRPIANTDLFILDAHGQPVPIGVAGELFIGGAGLARGYRGRPDLTAERFVSHPLHAGERVYRTGDRARWRADGTVDFLGRADYQVKLRGFRIELGEIEAALRTHPAVQEAVVVLHGDAATPGGPRLVAYVQPASAGPETLRTHLKGLLPDYMVPAAIVPLPALPRTPNGKIDRKALPAPTFGRAAAPASAADADAAPPLTPAEARLASIWRGLLGIDDVRPADDFFTLGGHSLLAMKLVHEVDRQFGVRLSPGALFESPELGALAARIAQAAGSTASDTPGASVSVADKEQVLFPLETGGSGTPFFWVHGVGGEIFSYMEMSRHLGPARPIYGFAADWTRIVPDGKVTLEDMAAYYVRELRAVQPSGPYYLGGFCSAVVIALEMARQLEAAGERVGLLAALDYSLSFASASGSWIGAARAFAVNLPRWIVDDALPSGGKMLLGRIRSGLRRLRTSVPAARRGTNGDGGGAAVPLDLRDRLGMWNFPDYQLPMIEAHHDAIVRYQPKPFNGRVMLFLPRTAPLLGPWPSPKQEAWKALALGGVDVHVVPGSHATMMREPFLGTLVRELARSLKDADDGKSQQS